MVGLGYMDMKASECYAKTSGLEHGTQWGCLTTVMACERLKGQRAAVGCSVTSTESCSKCPAKSERTLR